MMKKVENDVRGWFTTRRAVLKQGAADLERPAGEDRRLLIGICRVRVVYEKDSSCMEHGSSLGLFGLFGNA